MENRLYQRTGGEILVEQLEIQGVDQSYCVPGESYLAVLDALHDSTIELITCRHEGGASMMAEAYGKMTNKPGICFVTRAPGLMNALAGVHIAQQDSTPMILFVGQIDTNLREREAFQEVNYRSLLSDHVKWVTEIDDAKRIPEIMSRAFHIAISGRPGPVVIALPANMLTSTVTVANARLIEPIEISASTSQLERFTELLNQSQTPLMILGGSNWSADAVSNLEAFSTRYSVPIAVQFRRQMLFSTEHPNFVGDVGLGMSPALKTRIQEADTIILLGGRFSENPSQDYTLLNIPVPKQRLIHIHADISELNRVYSADLAINATPQLFSQQLLTLNLEKNWQSCVTEDRLAYDKWRNLSAIQSPGDFQMEKVMEYLNEELSSNAILTNGAGNFATWIHRFYQFRAFGTQLSPTSGTMGYGLPAAVAAKHRFPNREVICFAGDGDFMMTSEEFATAVQYKIPIIVIIIDNGMFGTIRMHQELSYPQRVMGTSLNNPDFAAFAKAYGGYGERVESTAQFFDAFERARASQQPAILHCLIDPEAITPNRTLTQLSRGEKRSH